MARKQPTVSMRELQRRLGVEWPPAHRFVARYGQPSEQDPAGRLVVSESAAQVIVDGFAEERRQAWERSRGRGPQ